MIETVRPAFTLLLVMTLLTGVIYPLAITGITQVLFPSQANGSILFYGDKVVGSELIGQDFNDPSYFWGRPSATSPLPYNPVASAGSNLGPTNPVLIAQIQARLDALKSVDPNNPMSVPVDLVTASASGLDPHISPAAAYYQVARIARLRNLSETDLRQLVNEHIIPRSLGILGEPRINVLQLNIALDEMTP